MVFFCQILPKHKYPKRTWFFFKMKLEQMISRCIIETKKNFMNEFTFTFVCYRLQNAPCSDRKKI